MHSAPFAVRLQGVPQDVEDANSHYRVLFHLPRRLRQQQQPLPPPPLPALVAATRQCSIATFFLCRLLRRTSLLLLALSNNCSATPISQDTFTHQPLHSFSPTLARPKKQRRAPPAQPPAQQQQQQQPRPQTQLLDLHDGVLVNIVRRLGVDRRTVMLVCRRLRDMAQGVVHSCQLPGMSVQDAIEAAEAGDTVHLQPGFYKEALLVKKPLHLTCDGGGRARILSPARFAIMVNARGCLLENLVLKSHQIDEAVFFLCEYGPSCNYMRLRHCEILQGSYIGIQDLKGPDTFMVLEHCVLHVGISLMAGRLDMSDTSVSGTGGDSLWSYPGTTLVARRCSFVDITDAVVVESETAVVDHCHFWAYDRGPLVVSNTRLEPEEQVEMVNSERLLYMEEEPPNDVWVMLSSGPGGFPGHKATGRRASEQQRAAVERGEVLPGKVVVWGNTSFESRSNEGITAQQEEVRREARALMLEMQREMEAEEGLDPDEVSIGNSVEDPEPIPGEDGHWDSDMDWNSSDSDTLDEDDIDSDDSIGGGSSEDGGWLGQGPGGGDGLLPGLLSDDGLGSISMSSGSSSDEDNSEPSGGRPARQADRRAASASTSDSSEEEEEGGGGRRGQRRRGGGGGGGSSSDASSSSSDEEGDEKRGKGRAGPNSDTRESDSSSSESSEESE